MILNRKNKNLMLVILGLIVTSLIIVEVSAASASIITAEYTSEGGSIISNKIYKTDSVVLRINTLEETRCEYRTESSLLKNFDGEYGLIHEVYIENLEEGFHKYYIRCGEDSNSELEVGFGISIPIYAKIKLSKEPPLKEGKYKISLITSKTSLETPVLEYSFDEIVYKPISLTGKGSVWEGNLIIPASVGESVCSFRFKAKDLTGEEGTKIIGDNSFIVDSLKPSTINIVDAVGYQGQIKLSWFSEESLNEFYVYRSENPRIEYTDFYKSSSKDYFYDNDVEKGKTYYYRVAGIDDAGNIGDLSKEVYATALITNSSQVKGLNPSLIGKVENQISEINTIIANVEEISYLIGYGGDRKREIFSEIKLDKEIEDSLAELNSIKRDVESYKSQDLSLEELNKKLDSMNLRINIVKKKIPEDIIIKEEKEISRELNEKNLQIALLEYYSNSESNNEKELNEILKIISEKKIIITGKISILNILYLDGTKKTISLLKEEISSSLEKDDELKFILVVPKEISEKASGIKMMNLDYTIVKDDPVLSFNSGTKKIVYYFSKEITASSAEEILIVPIKIRNDEGASKITGNFIFELGGKGPGGIIILGFFALILVIYFLKIKREPYLKHVITIIEDIKKSKHLLNEGKEEEALNLYNNAKERYKTLNNKEKKIVIASVKERG